jgi:hypothetical protein
MDLYKRCSTAESDALLTDAYKARIDAHAAWARRSNAEVPQFRESGTGALWF